MEYDLSFSQLGEIHNIARSLWPLLCHLRYSCTCYKLHHWYTKHPAGWAGHCHMHNDKVDLLSSALSFSIMYGSRLGNSVPTTTSIVCAARGTVMATNRFLWLRLMQTSKRASFLRLSQLWQLLIWVNFVKTYCQMKPINGTWAVNVVVFCTIFFL